MRIGVVGYSSHAIDVVQTRVLLTQAFAQFLLLPSNTEVELVTGLTNIGVPKVAYQIADERGWVTVGISAQAALRVRCGVYPVQKQWLVGEQFGDESEYFVNYIDVLVRVGGGKQSHREVAMFRTRCAQQGWDVTQRLIEYEMALLSL